MFWGNRVQYHLETKLNKEKKEGKCERERRRKRKNGEDIIFKW
jgi:hypothetical protein